MDEMKKDSAYLEFNRAEEKDYIFRFVQPHETFYEMKDIDDRAKVHDKAAKKHHDKRVKKLQKELLQAGEDILELYD